MHRTEVIPLDLLFEPKVFSFTGVLEMSLLALGPFPSIECTNCLNIWDGEQGERPRSSWFQVRLSEDQFQTQEMNHTPAISLKKLANPGN